MVSKPVGMLTLNLTLVLSPVTT